MWLKPFPQRRILCVYWCSACNYGSPTNKTRFGTDMVTCTTSAFSGKVPGWFLNTGRLQRTDQPKTNSVRRPDQPLTEQLQPLLDRHSPLLVAAQPDRLRLHPLILVRNIHRSGARLLQDILDRRPFRRRWEAQTVWSFPSSAKSHARASLQSRSTVSAETFNISAVSSTLDPPKKRSSITRALRA